MTRPTRRWQPFALRTDMFPFCLLVLEPLLIKSPLLFGILKGDPLLTWSGLGGVRRGLGGMPTIDPNIAYTSHALGSLSARLVLSGANVWWNPYEGVGAPLAGEMQAATLFPPTWLMIFAHGQLWEHLLMQVVAGTATFALLRRLRAGPLGAWLGGTAYCFNGAFAWLANAVINPICFLPVMLLGLEMLRPGLDARPRQGGALLMLGLAGSLYAGFPEVAYLDGLLVAAWTLLRLFQERATGGDWILLFARVAVFGSAGVLLAAPILAGFFDYLPVAFLGDHETMSSSYHLSPAYSGMLLVPYLPGAVAHGAPDAWGPVGGYAGVALTTLAAAGATARRERGLRLLLAGWTFFCLAATYGVPPFTRLILLVPGMSLIEFYRYLDASVLMAMAVLAGLGIDDLASVDSRIGAMRRVFTGVLVLAAGLIALGVGAGLRPGQALEFLPVLGQAAIVASLAAMIWSTRLPARTRLLAISLTSGMGLRWCRGLL